MSTIHLHQTTTSTPEQYVAGLTDFGPGRSKLFGNSADEYLKVHHCGRSEADATEGSGGIWERLHYDWSDPNRGVAVYHKVAAHETLGEYSRQHGEEIKGAGNLGLETRRSFCNPFHHFSRAPFVFPNTRD
jgi:hypothetical protein